MCCWKKATKEDWGITTRKAPKSPCCNVFTSCASSTHQNLDFSFKPSPQQCPPLKNHTKTEPYSWSPAQLCLLNTKDVGQNRQEVLKFKRKSPLLKKSSILVPPWTCWKGCLRAKPSGGWDLSWVKVTLSLQTTAPAIFLVTGAKAGNSHHH